MKAHHVVGARALSQDDSSYSSYMMIGEAGEGVGEAWEAARAQKSRCFKSAQNR